MKPGKSLRELISYRHILTLSIETVPQVIKTINQKSEYCSITQFSIHEKQIHQIYVIEKSLDEEGEVYSEVF